MKEITSFDLLVIAISLVLALVLGAGLVVQVIVLIQYLFKPEVIFVLTTIALGFFALRYIRRHTAS